MAPTTPQVQAVNSLRLSSATLQLLAELPKPAPKPAPKPPDPAKDGRGFSGCRSQASGSLAFWILLVFSGCFQLTH